MPPVSEDAAPRRRRRRCVNGNGRRLLAAAVSSLLLALLTPYSPVSATAVDVPAQLYLLGAQTAPDAPQELNGILERQLNGTTLSELSAALQRALLWDAGWLRLSSEAFSGSASSSAAAAVYVQVLVPCGMGMDVVFVARGALETRCALESECARPSGGNSSAWSCASTRDMLEMAQCAIQLPGGLLSGSATEETILENVSWPTAALASTIDASFDPQVFQFVNDTEATDGDAVLLIAERGSWRSDGDGFCSQAPLFVTPCRLFTSSSSSSINSGSDSDSGWCEPERLPGVQDWLSVELAALARSEQRVSGASSSSSSSSGGDKDTALLIGMVAAVVVLITVITVPFFVARRKQRASRQPPSPSRRPRRHHRQPRSRSDRALASADQSLSASDFRLLTDR